MGRSGKILAMTVPMRHLLRWLIATLRLREELVLENRVTNLSVANCILYI
jgi:hypothetical protein